jgi:hypothetical protein
MREYERFLKMSKIYPINRTQGNDIIDKLNSVADILNGIEEHGIIQLIGASNLVYQLTPQDQENIAEIMSIPNATLSTAGVVKPDGVTITVDEDGTLGLVAEDADDTSYPQGGAGNVDFVDPIN